METAVMETMNNLPDSVAASAAAAEETKKRVFGKVETPPPTVESSPAVSSPEVVQQEQVAESQPTPDTVSTERPPVQVPSQPVDENQRLSMELAEVKKRLSTFHGQYGVQLDKLRKEKEELQKLLDQERFSKPVQSQVASAPASAAPEAPKQAAWNWKDHVTQDQIESIGEEAMEAFGNLVTAAMQHSGSNANIADLISTVGASKKQMAQLEKRILDDRFWNETESLAPGAIVINGDPDNDIPPVEGWSEFLDQPLRPGSPITRRIEAEMARDKSDSVAYARLVNEFIAGRPVNVDNNHSRNEAVADQIVPTSVHGDIPPPPDPSKRMIKQSEIDNFNASCKNGTPPGMTEAEVTAQFAEYRKAHQEHRVVKG